MTDNNDLVTYNMQATSHLMYSVWWSYVKPCGNIVCGFHYGESMLDKLFIFVAHTFTCKACELCELVYEAVKPKVYMSFTLLYTSTLSAGECLEGAGLDSHEGGLHSS